MPIEHVPPLKRRCAHRDAESFGFVAARDHTAVVAAEDDDWFVCQIWSEQSLTADEEVVAVDECEDWCFHHVCHRSCLMRAVMMPHISASVGICASADA